jgi:hypothetical protein
MKQLINRKSTAIIVLLTLITGSLQSQVDFIWGRQFGSDKDQYTLNHVVDNKGNIFIAGKTTGVLDGRNLGLNDGFLVKYDSTGTMLWKKQFGSEGDDDVQWSAIDKAGSIYITGFTTGAVSGKNFGREDIFVVKFNPDGKLLWSKQIGTDSTDIAKGICTDNYGFIYITGMTGGKLGSRSFGKTDGILIKLDANGRQVYRKQFGTPLDDIGYSVTGAPDGNIYICGTTWGEMAGKSNGMIDGFTAKFAPNGDLMGYNQFGTEGFDIPMILKVDAPGNIYVAGTTSASFGATQLGEGDAFLLKMDNEGRILWNRQFGTTNHDEARSIDIDPVNPANILVSGIMGLPPGEAFIRMYTSDGTLSWERKFTAREHDLGTSGKDGSIDNHGNIIHVGLTGAGIFGPLTGENDVYVVKMHYK